MMLAQEVRLLEVAGFDIRAVLAEIILAAGGMVVLLAGAFLPRRRRGLVTGLALAVVLGAGTWVALSIGDLVPIRAFDEAVAFDGFAMYFKLLLLSGAALSIIAAQSFLQSEDGSAGEYYGLAIFATAGMMLMASATDLIVLFLALETFSLALYALAAFRRNRLDSQEGALKYFLTGSFSSAFFLYGTALLYGATGTTRFIGIAAAVRDLTVVDQALLAGGLALVLMGLLFKVAAVPFHMWTPDAYQGSPAPVAGFMAAGSKAAGFAALLRLLVVVFPALVWDWRPVVSGVAVLSMVAGSVIAVAQTNVKRVLAYSAIAHSGFLLVGLSSANSRGISGSLFYLGVYSFTIIGAFAIVYAVGKPGEFSVDIDDFRGLWNRRPFLAVTFALLLVSLTGIPPTAGFWAKFEVFSAAYSAGQEPLVVVGMMSSAVASFVYLKIIVGMFLEDEKQWSADEHPATAPSIGTVVLLAGAVVVVLGVFPVPLLDLVRSAGFVFR